MIPSVGKLAIRVDRISPWKLFRNNRFTNVHDTVQLIQLKYQRLGIDNLQRLQRHLI
jgi:hypothetical protein